MINKQPLCLQKKPSFYGKIGKNGSIIQWGTLYYWKLFSGIWYSEKKLFWNWICSCSDHKLFHVKRERERERERESCSFRNRLLFFRIPGNWQYRSIVRVNPSVDYHVNTSLLEAKWLNYSLPNVLSFLSNLIYQSSLVLLNCFLLPVNGSHLSTAARTLMIQPLLFAAWCLTTNSHPFSYNELWRKFYTLMSVVYFIKIANVLLMVIIFS